MQRFKLVSDYTPSGDQPEAIETLIKGIAEGKKHQVLLGVTGSGKTFTIANVIERLNRPTLVLSHNKTLAAQLYGELKQLFRKMLWNTLSVIMITISPKHIFRVKIFILKKIAV